MDAGRVDTSTIAGVQMLRLVAALAVLVHHAEGIGYHLGRYRGVELARADVMLTGACGVDLFFAISGFIMVVSAQRLLGTQRPRLVFIQHRLARIVPLYWLMTAFTLGWGWRFGPPFDLATTVHALAFLPYAPDGMPALKTIPLVVAWTLYYEMLFYAIFAACLASTMPTTVRRVLIALTALVAAGAVFDLPQPFAFWTEPIIAEFAGGMVIALAYERGIVVKCWMRIALLAAAAALIFATDYAAIGTLNGWDRTLTWGVAGWLILSAVVLGPLRLPAMRLWSIGGAISYALYLVHMPLMNAVQFIWRHFRWSYGPWQELVFVVGTMAASILAALILHRAFERPITQHLKLWLNPAAR
ncbi:peptidoglycan/LPS O-acetylase OafA/YrhL [Novosphingobium hassiacum]|uniref:Peptidoglycan/LPS O-acetylase OafA/YrhL n=1 Tax=Novosphingobium hassiacum TaxID=173676 RepID=A0A7W6A043_9SPHN|nr:acyltransferase [Novosphingobium hassiacum]MBB3860835.1 peptidoglycan/LPS O-acetylase OafA/YrhL [Novosphingobium hassiacum]